MNEYFVKGSTFAAPFVGDPIEGYFENETPEDALLAISTKMEDGIGLYSANAYASADDYHKGNEPLAMLRSQKALAIEGATMVRSMGVNEVEVDGVKRIIENPKKGVIID